MKEDFVEVIRENYNRLAAEHTAHISNELQHKPLDCELLRHFAERGRYPEIESRAAEGTSSRESRECH